jgi:hypothetical protein
MNNFFASDRSRDFFVYVDPKDFLIRHQVSLIGSFTSVPNEPSVPTLMFIPNPEFKTFISPFQNNLLRNYIAEYNLELSRQQHFEAYPCRLQAIFLLDSAEEAEKYATHHPEHVGKRILKRCKTVGEYCYSVHDLAWVDFLRIVHSMDAQTLDFVGRAYWSGELVVNHKLMSMGQSWCEEPAMEVLFLGRVDFYDKTLDS